jgi:hypothetical protein
MVLTVFLVDRRVTERSYKFAEQQKLPFYFVSAADGTNVVRVCESFPTFFVLTCFPDLRRGPPNGDWI